MTTPTQEIYSALQFAYSFMNKHLFDRKLPDCILTFQRNTRTMGFYSSDRWVSKNGKLTDEIAINPTYFAGSSLTEIMQTLVHEQVHMWQARFGQSSRRSYHNKQWASKMESLGLMPSSTGQPGGKKTGQHMSDYPIDDGLFLSTVRKLVDQQAFSLPWIDRHATETDHTVSEGLRRDHGNAIETTDVSEAEERMHKPLADVLQARVIIEPTNKRQQTTNQNKVKYSCPECVTHVWGKSGLNIVCGSCGSEYEENSHFGNDHVTARRESNLNSMGSLITKF